jgi:hypothetical protein
MNFEFDIIIDKLKVVSGYANNKSSIVVEAQRYFEQYSEEEFSKITLSIKKCSKK